VLLDHLWRTSITFSRLGYAVLPIRYSSTRSIPDEPTSRSISVLEGDIVDDLCPVVDGQDPVREIRWMV
jgi:hypothetical protein